MLISRPEMVAPAVDLHPEGAPPIIPMLFVIVACGAISGFHSLAGSGTTSKQLNKEPDARAIGYGGMLLEGVLAVLVIVACCAGFESTTAWSTHYSSWSAASGLGAKLGAFVEGSSYLLAQGMGIPMGLGAAIMGVFVVSFASTTLDSATRIQRYVISELARDVKLDFLANRYVATALAVGTAAALALAQKGGTGALILWPLFGATNQLLAGLALLVMMVWLAKQGRPSWMVGIPSLLMIVITGWAMYHNMESYFTGGKWHLFVIGGIIVLLEIWMIVEGLKVFARVRDRKGLAEVK